MTINLKKDEKLNLSKEASAGQQVFRIGIGWDEDPNKKYDLDVVAFCCKYDAGGNPKLVSSPGFVFYNNLKSPCGGVVHSGDNRTGAGAGDDETITIDFSKLAGDIDEISFIVNIHEGKEQGLSFGPIKGTHANIYEGLTGTTPLASYEPSEDFSRDTSIQLGSLYKKDGTWRWNSIGKGFAGTDLADFLTIYQ